MSKARRWGRAACLSAAVLAGCETASTPPDVTKALLQPTASDAGGACTPVGGPGATVTTSPAANCVGCTATQPELAGDGDTDTAATVVVGANSAAGFSLRVAAAPGATFPAGSHAGVLTGAMRVVGPGEFLVRTYLGGTLQDEADALDGGADQPHLITTTKAFDTVEIVFDSKSTTAGAQYNVREVCADSTVLPDTDGDGSTAAERFFGPPGGHSWTLQPPGKYTTAEMRDWFKTLQAAADSGDPITLPVSYFAGAVVGPLVVPTDETMDVVLQHSKMLDESTFFQINTVDHTGPFVRVYEGTVPGRAGSLVHLTLADDFMRGVVRIDNDIFLVRVGTNGNLPAALVAGGAPDYAYQEPASGDPVGCPADSIPGNNEDPNLPGGVAINGGHRFVPPYMSPEYVLQIGEAPELQARIILDADLDAYQRWGRHLPAMMIATHVEQSSTYRHQVGVRFRIAGVHLNTIPDYYPRPLDTIATFDSMDRWWGHYLTEQRDIVHLLTGQPISTYMASCIGGAGSPHGYFYTSTAGESSTASFRSMNFMSHEIGHLFSAHHHYGNHVEAGGGSATIMIQGYTSGDVPVFGSLERTVIRGWAEEYLPESD